MLALEKLRRDELRGLRGRLVNAGCGAQSLAPANQGHEKASWGAEGRQDDMLKREWLWPTALSLCGRQSEAFERCRRGLGYYSRGFIVALDLEPQVLIAAFARLHSFLTHFTHLGVRDSRGGQIQRFMTTTWQCLTDSCKCDLGNSRPRQCRDALSTGSEPVLLEYLPRFIMI